MKSDFAEQRQNEPPSNLFEDSEQDGCAPLAPQYEAITALQQELEAARDARKEERFVWFVTIILVFDIFAFKEMTTWAGPIAISIIQILLVVAVGRKWSMDHIYTITEMVINKWNGKFKGD
ncbi:hypothetical protein GRI33_01025 [Brucella sp. BO3]|uniref:hypothetical protein n=1 Tax=Brucella TaxID=234 RepID=UPI00086CBBC6|nr:MULTISPECIES: hypothetical protein [Brucella]OEI82465.1 hypothetical protein BA060_14860 [Brucella sp. B13-0095]QMV25594.1 hypothetical protein GRI33_01025 [Brucella sp. BO3]SCD22793.1 putative membrane protein [Brucella inopinata]